MQNIYGVNLSRCENLENIKGVNNSLKLKEILLDNCPSLQSLKGLENCEDLNVITLSKSGISNLDPLINCKKIFRNKNPKWIMKFKNGMVIPGHKMILFERLAKL